MENKTTLLKKALLALILLVLLLPLAQQHLKFYDSEKLHGAYVPKEQAWFSMAGWWSGDYQLRYEEWYNENFGFRNDLVRVHNQIAYSWYGRAKANGVVIGKENYLYELNYIRAYTGQDFIGMPQVNGVVTRIKGLQDSLAAKGKTLIICFAPGKASFFPEYIPDGYGPASDSSNYKIISKLLVENNVNVVDFNKWFMEMKGKTEYPLYPRTGIHWSRYGSTLALDSLISYIEHKRNVDLPDMIVDGTEWSDSLISPDQDIGLGMNLMWPIRGYKMGYPRVHFEDTVGKARVNLMTISDSYFWQMYELGLMPAPFAREKFYYYYKEVNEPGMATQPANFELAMSDVENSDVVLLIATEATVWGVGWGFIEDAFDHYVVHKVVQHSDQRVQEWEAAIRTDEKWMNDLRIKAAELSIPLDSMIRVDAQYMANEELKKSKQ